MKNRADSVVDVCKEYCTGCGLCGAVLNKQFNEDEKHFLYPNLTQDDKEFCETVCPAAGNAINNYSNGTIWGEIRRCCLGWSTDEEVRYNASSGGIITAMCSFLLEEHIVDGIIQIKKDISDPRKTVTVVSKTKEEVSICSGSRYTASSPLLHITSLIETGKSYAFVGKPCDVSALRMLQRSRSEEWTKQIKYMFSFFCAGQPSLAANNRLLSALGCDSIDECLELSYRGNGWPGNASVTLKNGSIHNMEYEKSWMTILGRDVRKCCRFCADGTGEMADISCGDAWYLTEEGKPNFKDHPGRNVVFCRTIEGENLLEAVIQKKWVTVEAYDVEKDKLKSSQPYHYNRKASLSSLKLALRICGRQFPMYNDDKLRMFAKEFPLKSKVYRCVGTIKRVWSKMI